MKVLYDHQRFSVQNVGGITRYFYGLINEFNNLDDIKVKLSILFSNNEYIQKYSNKFFPKINFKGKRFLMYKINNIKAMFDVKKNDYDIFHPTYYDNYFLPFLKKKLVVTVYDMYHELFLNNKNNETILQKKNLIYKADKIIAISQNTKNDILKLYNDINENKIKVIYLANSLSYKNIEKVNLPEKYILYIGHRNKYKNFENLAKAFSKINFERENLFLVCIGGGNFSKNEIIFLKQLNIYKNCISINVNDNQLTYIYKNALALVFPSSYEGFGIPILEAFYCECPLILSNTSCLPEIAQDCAEYFDPNNIEEMKYKIEKVINDKEIRKELTNKGLIRLKDFSWKKTALETLKVYNSVIG